MLILIMLNGLMDIVDLPRLKKASLDNRYTFAIDPELKKKLVELKLRHGVDVGEWIRNMIKAEMPKVMEEKV